MSCGGRFESSLPDQHADVTELADEADSKSVGSNTVWVQVPPSVPKNTFPAQGVFV